MHHSTNTDPSTTEVNRHLIERLYTKRVLTPSQRREALQLIHPHVEWGRWVSQMLLLVGGSLILSGIIYFFAFNWAALSSFWKFTALESSLLVCIVAALVTGLEKTVGKVWITAASILVGVSLAVFGQVYQTGADSYLLFTYWALFTLSFAVVARFIPLWGIWIVIVNTASVLYWLQEVHPSGDMSYLIFPILTALNGFFLILREIIPRSDSHWLQSELARVLLGLPILLLGLIPTCIIIVSNGGRYFRVSSLSFPEVLTVLVAVVVHAIFFLYYRFYKTQPWMLALCISSVSLALLTWIGRILFSAFWPFILISSHVVLFVLGVLTLFIFCTAVICLRKIMSLGGKHE